MTQKRTIPVLCTVLYLLAAVMLLLAFYILLTTLGFNRAPDGSMERIITEYGVAAGILAEQMKSVVGILSAVIAGVVFTMSALLFTAGQLLANSNKLSQRIALLEAKQTALEHSS